MRTAQQIAIISVGPQRIFILTFVAWFVAQIIVHALETSRNPGGMGFQR
jgi:hypothetical protein